MSKSKLEIFTTGAMFGRMEIVVRTVCDLQTIFDESPPIDEDVKATALRQLEIIERATKEFLKAFAPTLNEAITESMKGD